MVSGLGLYFKSPTQCIPSGRQQENIHSLNSSMNQHCARTQRQAIDSGLGGDHFCWSPPQAYHYHLSYTWSYWAVKLTELQFKP